MGRLRIVVTGLLALAFAFGPGWTPCIAFPQSHAASIASSDEIASQRSHGHHSHMTAVDDHASAASHAAIPAKDRESGHEDACLKCCAACIPTSILPRSEMVWAPAGSRIVFAALKARAPGRAVFVDPDIPKHVA